MDFIYKTHILVILCIWGIFKLLSAYNDVDSLFFTDESSLMEKQGHKIVIIPGSENNFKITTHNDWKRAELLLK